MAPSISHSWALPPGAGGPPEGLQRSGVPTFPPLCCQGFSIHPLSPHGQFSCPPFPHHIAQYLPVPPLGDPQGMLSSAYKTSASTPGRCHVSAAPTGARGSASPTHVCITLVRLHCPRECALPVWVCIAPVGLHHPCAALSAEHRHEPPAPPLLPGPPSPKNPLQTPLRCRSPALPLPACWAHHLSGRYFFVPHLVPSSSWI